MGKNFNFLSSPPKMESANKKGNLKCVTEAREKKIARGFEFDKTSIRGMKRDLFLRLAD